MGAIQVYKHAFVNVTCATVWRSPGSIREVDEPALKNPAQLDAWLKTMTHEERLDLVGRVDTQCLYGEKVLVNRRAQNWAQIEVLTQPGKSGAKSYPGWIPVSQLTANAEMEKAGTLPHLVIIKPKAFLYDDKECSKAFHEVSFNTQLPIREDSKEAFGVITPDGEKWAKKVDIDILDGEHPTGEKLIQTAKQFLGLDYLWGGTSAWGFDCSGFAYAVHKRFGIMIPRDADDQFYANTPILREDLQAGDLVFFAYKKGLGAIHHVGFYAGDGVLLHAPQTGESVETLDLWNHDVFPEEFVGGCRYI